MAGALFDHARSGVCSFCRIWGKLEKKDRGRRRKENESQNRISNELRKRKKEKRKKREDERKAEQGVRKERAKAKGGKEGRKEWTIMMRQLGQKGKSEEWRTKRVERRDQLKSSSNAIFATIRDFSSKGIRKGVNEFTVLGVDI